MSEQKPTGLGTVVAILLASGAACLFLVLALTLKEFGQ